LNRKRFNLVWIGKTRENFILEGIQKYVRLLEPYAEVKIVQIKEEKMKDPSSALKREAGRVLKSAQRFILLHEKGRLMDSVGFSRYLEGRREATFVVGGPYGVSEELIGKAEETLSLSPMTFTHEMTRLILLEQLYRAMTIIKGKGYHH
jgi:23S rRNA (pseudouridine1915-N3)-methyltransferase